MADLDIYYKGNKIFTADDDVRENLNTAGKYCKEDIIVDYKKPTLPPLTNPATDSEVVDGYEYYDDQGVAQTGSFVPPVDTGANGLYKSMIAEDLTEIVDDGITQLRQYAQSYNTSLVKVSLPNLETTGIRCFLGCSNLTGIINVPKATLNQYMFIYGGRRTVVLYAKELLAYALAGDSINTITYRHLWLPNEVIWSGSNMFDRNSVTTVQADLVTSINASGFAGGRITALILRNPNGTRLTTSLNNISTRKIYVPKSLYSTFYATETNWVALYNAGAIIPIDEDTTATVGTMFTPTATATVDHWDQVDLQSYSVGTVDTTTGAITPTHDGRLLIRGLDSSNNILHVTYLQIGTGFDEEQNLLENI